MSVEQLERLNQINLRIQELRGRKNTISEVWELIDLEDELDEIKYLISTPDNELE